MMRPSKVNLQPLRYVPRMNGTRGYPLGVTSTRCDMEPRYWVTVRWITLPKLSLYKEDPKVMATVGGKIPWDTWAIALIFGAFKMEF